MVELAREWGTWLDASGWATVVGLVASIVGIAGVPFAVWNAWRAKRAAEAARAAAEATALRIDTIDAVRNLASTLAGLDEVLDRLGQGVRAALPKEGKSLRRELIDLAEIGSLFPPEERAIIQATIQTLRDVEEWSYSADKADRDTSGMKLRARLAARLDEMYRVQARLRHRGRG